MDSVDTVVVGAGVVGLAIARASAIQGWETLVLERETRPGQGTTSRNSGVIHSGIYYPGDSLKACLCVHGRGLLYEYCQSHAVEHRRCGKLVVANEAQVSSLLQLYSRGIQNGVADLQVLTSEEVRRFEPSVRCAAGLWSPSTGIIDVHQLLLALIADLEAANGTLVLRTAVERVQRRGQQFLVDVNTGGELAQINCRFMINCTGLSALDFLTRIEGYPTSRLRAAYYAKGNYFSCQGVRPFKHLVYPMPNEAGLGVHATLDLDGSTRFGPDVQWVERPDYSVDPTRAVDFYSAIREYWPGLPDGALHPAYAGVRPKLVGPGAAAGDFEIEGPEEHGMSGLVNLLGIESPGLTSSLAIGEHVIRMLQLAA